MERIKCSCKSDWSKLMMNNNIDCIDVEIDDEYQLHNLIYFLITFQRNIDLKLKNKLSLNLYINNKKKYNDIYYKIQALFYLLNIKFTFYADNKAIEYRKIKPNFSKILPILIFTKDDLNSLRIVDKEINSILNKQDLQIKNKDSKFICFIRNFIIKAYRSINNKYIDLIKSTANELNLLTLFIFIYYFSHRIQAVSKVDKLEVEDLKQVIRNYSIGIFQIIENACIHSQGKKAYVYFSKLSFKEKSNELIKTYVETQNDIINKKKSFINNYNFQIDLDEYLFVRIIDDTRIIEESYVKDKISIANNIVAGIENINKLTNKEKIIDYYSKTSLKEIYQDYFKNNIIDNELEIKEKDKKYGIRLFLYSSKILSAQFLLNSCEESFLFTNYNFNNNNEYFYDSICDINTCVTEYDCIFSIKPIEKNSKKIYSELNLPIGILDNNELEVVDLEILDIDLDIQMSKEDKVKPLYYKLQNYQSHNNNIILKINIYSLKSIEILVKALSNHIFKNLKNKNTCYIALNFIDNEKNELYNRLSEFFNYLRILNYKLNIIIRDIEVNPNDIQIGFYHTLDNKMHYLATMVGVDWNIMTYTFINDLLYNNEFSENNYFKIYLDEIKILNKFDLINKVDIKILPFEIYIKESNKNRFITNLENIVKNNNIAHYNTNILLGSGLYLNNFYEAEHIFQNRYLMTKLALIIKDQINNIDKFYNKIIIVGYANYSHLLCEELKQLLNKNNDFLVDVITILNSNESHPSFEQSKISSFDLEKTFLISILPIGSTLGTYFSMNTYIRKIFNIDKNKYVFKKNICVFLVSPSNEKGEILTTDYWEETQENDKCKVIKIKNGYNENIEVNCLIHLKTDWNKEVGTKLAISHVDKTSTLPLTIYDLDNKNKEKSDLKNFKYLKGAVEYGHYCLDNNHYLYYINHDQVIKNYEEMHIQDFINDPLIIDLKNESKKIDKLAYNIIISPLNNGNNKFLNKIINYVFLGNVTLIQFDQFISIRENFINKYKYISENLKAVLSSSTNTNINIYFVDNTIISSKTISRAKQLMKALINNVQNFQNDKRIPNRIFEKAYILINRCSLNTLSTVMDNEENIYRFINICCPSFDTNANICPDCKISDNYRYLSNLTTNIELVKKLQEYEMKHKLLKIRPDIILNYKDEDFIKLCFTHLILKNKYRFIETYNNFIKFENEDDCYEFVEKIYNEFIRKISKLVKMKNCKSIFIKVLSRPLISSYESIKQVSYIYLKKELEKNKQEKNKEYIKLLINRLAYFGTNYLNKNKNSLIELIDNENFTKIELEKSLFFEEALSRGIIK